MFRALYSIFFLIWLSCPLAVAASTAEDGLPAINVLADRALTIPLTQLASEYSRTHQASVTITFAPSFEQMLAIEEGEPANLFISAHPGALQQLKQQGLFDVYSLTPLMKGAFALITSTGYPDNITTVSVEALRAMLKDQPEFLLAVANAAATAEGYYTAQILDKIRPDISLFDTTVQLQNTEDILSFGRKTPSFGIVFESDALQHPDFTTLGTFPEEWHEEAVFNGVVLAGPGMDAARNFLSYLITAEAQRHFIRYRFSPVIRKSPTEPTP